MITLPKTGIWTQPNTSDALGDLWASFNLDTSENLTRLRLGKRLILNTGTSDVAQLTAAPIAFINNSAAVFTFAGTSNVGYAFKNDATMIGTFTRDSSTGNPTKIDSAKSDATFSNNAIYVTSQKSSDTTFLSIFKKPLSSAWSEIVLSELYNDVYTNMLCSYANRLYMSNTYSKIISLDSSDSPSYSGAYTVLVGSGSNDPGSSIIKLLPADDRIFILTQNLYGGQGHVYEWDGAAQTTSYDHRLESSGALAGVMFEGTPYIVDTNACLLAWNGGTFVEVACLNRDNGLPLVYTTNYSALNNRFIHPNGMTIVDGKINILIDNKNADSTGTIEETIPSGIYEFDPRNPSKGLIHKHAISSNKAADIATNFGQVRITGVGALKNMNIPSTAAGANGTFFVGSGYYTDATTIKYGIFYDDRNDTLPKSGYLITSKLLAQNYRRTLAVDDCWNDIYSFHRVLLSSNDRIVLKYRLTDVAPIEATVTWTSTTTFTTTTDVSAYQNFEAEILQGIGAGISTKILTVVNNAGTYTVTLKDTIYGATGTAKVRFQYWVERDTINNQKYHWQKTPLGVQGTWIQFKIFMYFTGRDEIEKFEVANQINQQIE